MTKEQHETAKVLLNQIKHLKKTKQKMQLAVSENFKARQFEINIYGTHQEEGSATVSKECFKTVCEIILTQTEVLLYKKEQEFKTL